MFFAKGKVALLITTIILSGMFCCTHESNKNAGVSRTGNSFVLKDSVFLSMNGYGYDITLNGAVIIHQVTIPGIAGTSGFASEEDARKIAHLAILKIMNNQAPPAISLQDLQSSGIIVYNYRSRTGLYRADM
jgi:hypothetical protein